jgi:hypothetical protein
MRRGPLARREVLVIWFPRASCRADIFVRNSLVFLLSSPLPLFLSLMDERVLRR